jgi:hypothetical protein
MNVEMLRGQLLTEIKRLTAAYDALAEPGEVAVSISTPTSQRAVSDETRKKISKSMKKNWKTGRRSTKRKLSPEVRAKIAVSQKARWAKAKVASATVAAAQPVSKAA